MNNILDLLPASFVPSLGWTLLHALWQATALCMVAAAGFYLLKHRSAQTRYVLGITLLGGQVLASIATFMYYQAAFRPSQKVFSSTLRMQALPENALLSTTSASVSFSMQVQLWLSIHMQELVVCWFIGVAVLLVRFLGGWLYLERLRLASSRIQDNGWNLRFRDLMNRLRIQQTVDLRESVHTLSPMVVGVVRPVVLMPLGLLSGLSPQEFEAILAHELAHIRRHDYLVNLLQSFVEVIYFFHPGLWWLSGRIRAEREHCCDDLALSVCDDRSALAHALLRVAEFGQSPALAVAFASRKPLLLQRVRRVLGVASPARRPGSYFLATLLLLSMLAGVSVYAIQADSKEDKSKTSKAKETKETFVAASAVDDTTNRVEEELTLIPGLDLDVFHAQSIELTPSEFVAMSDTLREKRALIHEKMRTLHAEMKPHHAEMQALQKQMQPLNQRMHEIHLAMEKHQFEVERYQREEEKIEWKKQSAHDERQKLMDKRSAVMYPKSGQNTANPAETEKKLAEFETQIKAKEQEISALNDQLAQVQKQQAEAEKPLDALNADMEKINQEVEALSEKMEQVSEKIELIGQKLELEANQLESYVPAPPAPPRPAKAPKAPKAPGATSLKGAVAAPPAPAKAPRAPAAPKKP
ncbi:M56 family metallopeptidase [Arundinibacter roseus]|uniref:Peptidase M56 domain-containing protein n=1 Tax=Arundinibacter roseus TaxID=2070510 RepID=A0A4R4JZJ4_9BACT|nr:M56 family metallopeptidase [Arundinibacter roseus]TDB59109.1 hypothetical protein EZE20_22515 [Arundinibacter roseus]